ncbi:hypothetical protein TNCV_417261 [Trichonephila clavipes]|nr:hypothetical protein TNCV_417261 [Trichonephila clavipes]
MIENWVASFAILRSTAVMDRMPDEYKRSQISCYVSSTSTPSASEMKLHIASVVRKTTHTHVPSSDASAYVCRLSRTPIKDFLEFLLY